MHGLLFISFIAGALTVLAPCILPLLPVIVGGALSGRAGASRALIITASLGVSVILFTLLLKVSTALISVPPIFWQILSGGLLLIFGIVTFWPALWDRLPGVGALYRGSNRLLGSGFQQGNVWGEVVMGMALGPVFSSCSPTYFVILAAVLPAHLSAGVAYLIAYALGLTVFLFIIAVLGQRAATWLGIATDPRGWFKRGIGALFIIVGLAVIFGLDKQLEAALPQSAFGEVGLEQQLLSGSAHRGTKAPELEGIAGYINTNGQPITLSQYIGKDVVLVDFWDYSCINCQRTTPYLNAWYQKYKDQGLVIVGVHTPEFAFEQLQSNVEAAVKSAGIQYPVVLDNQYKTWDAFNNQYWPNEYLINIDGNIVDEHSGEGDYTETEAAIQAALAERAQRMGQATSTIATSTVDVPQADLSAIESPETYFGSARNEFLGNGIPGLSGTRQFTLPQSSGIEGNMLYLGGTWNITPQYAEGRAGDTVEFEYGAHNVYMVAANPNVPAKIEVLRDGVPVGAGVAGSDVDPNTGEATIQSDRLYSLIKDASPGVHTIEIKVISGTLDAFTFTFG